MTQALQRTSGPAAEPGARHLMIVCAILAAAARFIPVPLLDDVVRERIRQIWVSRTLKSHGRSYSSKQVPALWQDPSGCAGGCLALWWKLPLKLLLFPIRKLIAIFSALSGLSKDVTEMVLFGRCTQRVLESGMLPEGGDQVVLAADARRIRSAFDVAFKQTDTSVLVATLRDVLQGVRGLSRAAVKGARAAFRAQAVAAHSDGGVVDQGARDVQRALDSQALQSIFRDFDARFDTALAASTAQS
ncbi:MAG TPA: hypothetical protein PKD61_00765 [Polyangiaceae bacterium]|nr:hypothetical protein [Polyangiaceae bacterium]